MIRFAFFVLIATFTVQATFAGSSPSKYEFLKSLEKTPPVWTPEESPQEEQPEPPILDVPMADYYKAFQKDGVVTLFISWGYESWSPTRPKGLFEMLQATFEKEGLKMEDWKMSEKLISFVDPQNRVKYQIGMGHERNEWAKALSQYEVVMYHGHSRYGRGPAFDSFWNYFRMGNVFDTIEMDTRNPYFQSEPIQLTSKYPVQEVTLDETKYPFQYRGQKVESSYLSQEAYTKNIPEMDKDLRNAGFLSGKQIVWLYSCRNYFYWKSPLRKRFPDPKEKLFFGTDEDGYWGSSPAAVFIVSLVKGLETSTKIVAEENATQDCRDCFTAY